MTSTMTERFGVSGALLVKLFGRPARESEVFSDRAAKVRDSGVEMAVASRAYYGDARPRRRARHRRGVLARRPRRDRRLDQDRHAHRARRLRGAAVLAAHRPGLGAGRPVDRAGVVRPRLRGARRAPRHRRQARRGPPRRRRTGRGEDRARRRVVPLPGPVGGVDRLARGAARYRPTRCRPSRRSRSCAASPSSPIRARSWPSSGPTGAGKTTLTALSAACTT